VSATTETVDPRLTVAPAGAPVTGWRRALTDWALVGGATGVCHALGAVTSLLLRFLLDPAQMGIWQAVRLFLTYGNYANLGISKGAVRELTVARGHGNETEARRGLNLAFTVNTISSLGYAAILVTAGIWYAQRGGEYTGAWSLGLIVAGLLAVLSRYVTFHVTILRGRQAFGATSRLSLLEAVLTLGVGGLATWLWGLPGLYFGTLLVMLASLAFVLRHRGATLRWAWDGAEIRRLIGIGGPILLATTLFTLFRSLDKLMILAYMSDCEYQLGCYSIALLVVGQIYGLGAITSMVMSPRLGETFGATDSRIDVARLTARTGELQAAAMGLIGGVSLVLAGPVLGTLLPDYRPGLPAMKWLIPGAVLMTIALPANHYLIAVNRQRRALAVVAAVLVLAVTANHWVLTAGLGLVGVAMATGAAYACYWVLIVGVSFWGELPVAERRRFVGLTALLLTPTLSVAWCVASIEVLGSPGAPVLAARLALVLAVWAVSAGVGWHWGDWREQLKR
jgi:O-antigen/teichoic acid export membrane protein